MSLLPALKESEATSDLGWSASNRFSSSARTDSHSESDIEWPHSNTPLEKSKLVQHLMRRSPGSASNQKTFSSTQTFDDEQVDLLEVESTLQKMPVDASSLESHNTQEATSNKKDEVVKSNTEDDNSTEAADSQALGNLLLKPNSVERVEVTLLPKTIWVGSFLGAAIRPILLSEDGICFYMESVDRSHKFCIHPFEIIQCLSHFNPVGQSMIFFVTTSGCAVRISKDLGIKPQTDSALPAQDPYFDPQSKEEAHQLITVALGTVNDNTKADFTKLMELYKETQVQTPEKDDQSFYMELNEEEACQVYEQCCKKKPVGISLSPAKNTPSMQLTGHAYFAIEEDSSCLSPPMFLKNNIGSTHTFDGEQVDLLEVESTLQKMPVDASSLESHNTQEATSNKKDEVVKSHTEDDNSTEAADSQALGNLLLKPNSVERVEVTLLPKTIWVGSFLGAAIRPILLSEDGICFYMESVDRSHKFCIHPFEIIQCLSHFNPVGQSMIFFVTTSGCAVRISKDLGIKPQTDSALPAQDPYFDPQSKEEAHQLITVALGTVNDNTKADFTKLMELYKETQVQTPEKDDQSFYMELNEEEACQVYEQCCKKKPVGISLSPAKNTPSMQLTGHAYFAIEEDSSCLSPPMFLKNNIGSTHTFDGEQVDLLEVESTLQKMPVDALKESEATSDLGWSASNRFSSSARTDSHSESDIEWPHSNTPLEKSKLVQHLMRRSPGSASNQRHVFSPTEDKQKFVYTTETCYETTTSVIQQSITSQPQEVQQQQSKQQLNQQPLQQPQQLIQQPISSNNCYIIISNNCQASQVVTQGSQSGQQVAVNTPGAVKSPQKALHNPAKQIQSVQNVANIPIKPRQTLNQATVKFLDSKVQNTQPVQILNSQFPTVGVSQNLQGHSNNVASPSVDSPVLTQILQRAKPSTANIVIVTTGGQGHNSTTLVNNSQYSTSTFSPGRGGGKGRSRGRGGGTRSPAGKVQIPKVVTITQTGFPQQQMGGQITSGFSQAFKGISSVGSSTTATSLSRTPPPNILHRSSSSSTGMPASTATRQKGYNIAQFASSQTVKVAGGGDLQEDMVYLIKDSSGDQILMVWKNGQFLPFDEETNNILPVSGIHNSGSTRSYHRGQYQKSLQGNVTDLLMSQTRGRKSTQTFDDEQEDLLEVESTFQKMPVDASSLESHNTQEATSNKKDEVVKSHTEDDNSTEAADSQAMSIATNDDEAIVSSTTEKNEDCGETAISGDKGGAGPGRLLIDKNSTPTASVENKRSEPVRDEIWIDSVFSLSHMPDETTAITNEDMKSRKCDEKNEKEEDSSQTKVSLVDGSNSHAVSKKDIHNVLRLAISAPLSVANSTSTILPIRPTLLMNQVTSGNKVLTLTNQSTQSSQTTGSTTILTSQSVIAKPSMTVTDLRSTISQVFTPQASSNPITISPSPGQSLLTRLPLSGVMPSTVATKSTSGMQQHHYLIKVDNKNILIPANLSHQQPRAYVIPQKDSAVMPMSLHGKDSSISKTKENITLVSVLPTGKKANQNIGSVSLASTSGSGPTQGKTVTPPNTLALSLSYPTVKVKSEPRTEGYGDEENTITRNESWIKKEPITSGYGDEGNSNLSSINQTQHQKEQVKQRCISGISDLSGTKRKGLEDKDDRANRVKSMRLQSNAGEANVYSEVRGSEEEKVDGSSDTDTTSEISKHDGSKSLLTESGLTSREDKIRRLKQLMQEKMKALEEFKRQRHIFADDNN